MLLLQQIKNSIKHTNTKIFLFFIVFDLNVIKAFNN